MPLPIDKKGLIDFGQEIISLAAGKAEYRRSSMRHTMLSMVLTAIVLAGSFSQVWATFARVESMGKRATFFMDDVSIFQNPANMNIFPNFLIGELGTYHQGAADRDAISQVSADSLLYNNPRYNRDPENSWFGGIFSYSLSRNKEMGAFYPQISIGGALNRKDEQLFALLPDSADGVVVPDPVTNFDGFLGFTLGNGGMVGSHLYAAIQEGAELENGRVVGTPSSDINTYIMRFDLGVNWPVARNMDAELTLGLAGIDYGPGEMSPEYSFFVRSRAFSTLEIINGELVPVFNYNHLQAPGMESKEFEAGVGVNVSLDRGFFWLGVLGLWTDRELNGVVSSNGTVQFFSTGAQSAFEQQILERGASISFGIERNIWWDWLVLRVGGRKVVTYYQEEGLGTAGPYEYNFISSNPVSNTLPDDHVGFGLGINIEEKLKIDATVAEDVVYTFGNFLSGPHHHIISRISATYSF